MTLLRPSLAAAASVGVDSRPAQGTLRTALVAGLAAAAAQIAVAAPFIPRYGWDRDELYFLEAAKHPALGYVDFPPLTAWLAWLVNEVDPGSLAALRWTSLLLGAATVVLVALTARELGGGARAQAGAAFAWALSPYILGSASIFHPTWLDCLAWTGFLYLATRLAVRGDERLWPALGAVAGIGLEAKYTIAFLLAAFALALLASPQRRLLLGRGPWLGLAVAAALLAPNLVWQAQHGWPSLHFFSSQEGQTAADTPPATYIAEGVLFLGASSIVAAVGVVSLWRRGLRGLALVPVLVTLVFLLERGRAYYPLPADGLAVAAGAVALERWVRRGRRLLVPVALAALQAAVILLAAPVVVPFYSTAHLVSSGVWKDGFFKDEIGWPEMTRQVEQAWRSLPPRERRDGVVLAQNYGEASALAVDGRGLGPVVSGHLSWQYWRPRTLPQRHALTIGYATGELPSLCARYHVLAHVRNRWHLANQELGEPIAACTLRAPLGRLWPSIASDQL